MKWAVFTGLDLCSDSNDGDGDQQSLFNHTCSFSVVLQDDSFQNVNTKTMPDSCTGERNVQPSMSCSQEL